MATLPIHLLAGAGAGVGAGLRLTKMWAKFGPFWLNGQNSVGSSGYQTHLVRYG
jgi:hypothetical protein